MLPVLLLLSEGAMAHEAWFLTPEEMAAANARPKPEIFTTLNSTNISILVGSALFLFGWISLHFTGAREMFTDLRLRLASFGDYASVALRIGLGVMFVMAAFGMSPRHGTEMFEVPVLAAPDLQLTRLAGDWAWIAWAEALVGIMLLLGIYVRLAAAACLGLASLGAVLFPHDMQQYFGVIVGAGIYLLLQGAGTLYIPMPSVYGTQRIAAGLASQPRERAAWLMRVLAGLCFIYLGIQYKVLQPNLILEGIVRNEVPTFGMAAETFVFFTAIVETVAGLLLVAGVLIRPLATFLLVAFIFLNITFGEGILSHIFAFGILVACVLVGAGRWRWPEAKDKPGRIVILGGSFAGVQCAMKLERLCGEFTNLDVVLVHAESSFQFHPLLPEVIGGAVQPGNIVNPIRRICPRTRFLEGEVSAIDHTANQVIVTRRTGEKFTLDYDQLVVALELEANYSCMGGLLENAVPIMTIGDALFLRQRILACMDRAENTSEPQAREAILTFAFLGGGLRGAAAAAETRELINSAMLSYPGIDPDDFRVILFEAQDEVIPRFPSRMGRAARRRLEKLGVEVRTGTTVSSLGANRVHLADGETIRCHSIVNAMSNPATVVSTLPGIRLDGRLDVDDFLRLKQVDNVFVVGDCASTPKQMPFLPRREIKMGRRAALNAWSASQGYKLERWKERHPLAYIAALGRHASVGRLLGVPISGFPAWLITRAICLLTLPGLERNLRILIDWAMDAVFRNDIAVLAPQRSRKLTRLHFNAGDWILRQGEKADRAYIIFSGRVEVVRDIDGMTETLARLEEGDCFGETALLSDAPWTASVRALTPTEITVIPRDYFQGLGEGYWDLVSALSNRRAQLVRAAPLTGASSNAAAIDAIPLGATPAAPKTNGGGTPVVG